MANKKKPPGFMIYLGDCKWLKMLTLEQKGLLLDALVVYADTGECVMSDDDSPLKLLFDTMADAIDRDCEKYNENCEKNSSNAKKGWENKRRKPMPNDATACDGMRTDATALIRNANGCETMPQDANTNPISKPISNTNTNAIGDGGKPPARSTFTIPTIDEVAAYCRERGNNIDAEYFCAYYGARGWELSKGKRMKDWKLAVVTWEKRDKERLANANKPDSAATGGRLMFDD